jgi:hypothetical protein
MRRQFALMVFVTLFPLGAAAETKCDLPMSGIQSSDCTDKEKEKGKASCPRTLLYDQNAIVFSSGLHVDTDGNIRAYSAQDPFGSKCSGLPASADPMVKGCAMDTVCNAVSVKIPQPGGGTTTLPGYIKGDKKACGRMVAKFEEIRDKKWLPEDGSRVDFKQVIATQGKDGDQRHVPCEVNGFLVSKASTPSGVPGKDRCDPVQWVDSAVPSVVVPQCWSTDYRNKDENVEKCSAHLKAKNFPDVQPGDLVALRWAKKPKQLFYVLVGDMGPVSTIGEASVGFHIYRNGKEPPFAAKQLPFTHAQADRLDAFEQQFEIVVFPGSALKGITLTPENFSAIKKASQDAFAKWGAEGREAVAVEKLKACAVKARQ